MIRIDAFEAIRGRRSIRRFTEEPIPGDLLEDVIDAACWAPYGTHRDERALVVLAGDEKARVTSFLAERLDEVLPGLSEGQSRQILTWVRSMVPIIETAPVLVTLLTEIEREGPELSLASAACAAQNLMLAAHAAGLGSCYITGALYLADEIVHLLGAPRHRLVGMIPLGYPAGGDRPRRQFPAVAWRGFDDRDEQELAVAEEPEISTIIEQRPGNGERILMVTDVPEVDRPILSVLEQAGYEVFATGPVAALEAFVEHQPRVTIVDAILGEMDGYELARRIRESVEGPCPVIITTSAYDASDDEQALIAGASDVLVKPIREHELLARVRTLADSRGLYEELDRHAEELQQANDDLRELQRLRDDLTHMIVHDMRTPLTNIITGLQTVEDTDYDDELTREFLPAAISAGEELAEMINNLLDISKMEAGELEPERESFDLRQLVSETFERVSHLARDAELELRLEVDEDLMLNADRKLIRRVLVNLIGNAIKFTPPGGSVTVSAEAREDEVEVCVIDTGQGISQEEQKLLFRKFAQLADGRKKAGTGLGLAFVRLAVEAHGGSVRVESEVGEGSSFCFTIPHRQ